MRQGQKVANDVRKGLEREQRQERTAARQQRRNELASPLGRIPVTPVEGKRETFEEFYARVYARLERQHAAGK